MRITVLMAKLGRAHYPSYMIKRRWRLRTKRFRNSPRNGARIRQTGKFGNAPIDPNREVRELSKAGVNEIHTDALKNGPNR